jgi:hypothetical protein
MMETFVKEEKSREKHQLFPLHRAEVKLITAIRSIGFGEIEGLKIKNRLPQSYRAAKKTCKF